MTETPYFSIIIPTYNRANFILLTLDSVFNQSYKNYEIIVVDDHSTDNTNEVLSQLIKSNKIKFLKNKKNSERAFSRNIGMQHAKGKFVTFLDSDDLMYQNCLNDAYNFVIKNPKFNIFHNRFEIIDENGICLNSYEWKQSNDHLKDISTGNFLACIGVFISKNIYSNFRFDEERFLSGSEDWDFWLRVMANEKVIGKIDNINSAMVDHSNRSMNNLELDQLIKRRQYIINKIEHSLELHKTFLPYLNFMKASSYLFIASNAAAIGFKKEAQTYLKKALTLHKGFIFSPRFLITLKNILIN